MSCPDSVYTFPIKGCEAITSKIIVDNYKWDTGLYVECYDNAPVMTEKPKYKVTNLLNQLSTQELMWWHEKLIANGTAPFALYGDWGGEKRWYIVKLVTNRLTFDYTAPEWRKTPIEVHILGYAQTVTNPTPATPLTCSDGATFTEDDCDVWCDSVAGTATDIICY